MTTKFLAPLLVLVTLAITGCATSERWSSGGNRDIGIVRLSYAYGAQQEPVMNESQAAEIAENRCNTWGYSRAEPIPGELRACTAETENRCEVWKVTREYRCEDAKNGRAALASSFAR